MNKKLTAAQQAAFLAIAKRHLNPEIETLAARNSDSLDFYDVGVLGIASALEEAYRMGREAGKKDAAR